jgi:glycosyltransferase involved in cell wall biosynthesis
MVLLEAMFFGKATIIGDIEGSGMGWVVDDEVTGLKVKPADANALAEAIGRFAANRDDMIRMGQRGKEKFDRQFEINHAVEPLVDVYEAALTPRDNDR